MISKVKISEYPIVVLLFSMLYVYQTMYVYSFRMEKPLVTRSARCRRGVPNLAKPAPRKNNINVDTSAIPERAELAEICTGKENIKTVGKRAARGLKLEKPLPRVNSK